MRRMTRVIARPISGSAAVRPSATTIALAMTASDTQASARACATVEALSGACADPRGDRIADETDRAGAGKRAERVHVFLGDQGSGGSRQGNCPTRP